MRVYTLIGKSGTGKSFHAMNLCRKYNIEAVIDDGLFIYKNTVIAGVSAKKSTTKVGAIKTAIFYNEEITQTVRAAIKEKNPESLLILATSNGMAEKIAERLGIELPPWDSPNHIKIESITTLEERLEAREQRDIYGKHVIPAPTVQLKLNFAGYFMDPLRIFRGKEQGARSERTVVRPAFSYLGEYYVSDNVVDDICRCTAAVMPEISKVIFIAQIPSSEYYEMNVSIRIKPGCPVFEVAERYQANVKKNIEEITAFNVKAVDIEIREIG